MSASQPNLRDSGHSAPSHAISMRQNTRAPGALAPAFRVRQAVEGEQAALPPQGGDDVPLLLDGVAEGHPLRRDPLAKAKLDLAEAGDVEIGALRCQHADDFGGRVGLDRIEDTGERQGRARAMSYAATTSTSTTRHGVSGERSARKREIL